MNSTALIMFPVVSPRFSAQKTFTHQGYSKKQLQAAINEFLEFTRRSDNKLKYRFNVPKDGKVCISNRKMTNPWASTLFERINGEIKKALKNPGALLNKFITQTKI